MTVSSRWGQLTYTSYDDGVRPGGWQVKQTTGGLDEKEQRSIVSRIETTLRLQDELPRFPTKEQIEGITRRLVYVADETGVGRYWHTIPAGADATGRPGNVFVHAVIDRELAQPEPAFRPAQLWASPDWLCPYGADAVRTAQLPNLDRPRIGSHVSKQRVVEFLLDPSEWHIGVLATLLDAVDAALGGGANIILAAESPELAAIWLGAVSFLMPADHARRLSWSTYARADEIDAGWRHGITVAAIPFIDLVDLAPGTDAVIIDSSETVALGVLGRQPHRTGAGSSVKVTPWSLLAEAALTSPDVALAVLARIDEIAAAVPIAQTRPAWALAAAMSMMKGQFAEVAGIIEDLLLGGALPDLTRAPRLSASVSQLLRQRLGSSPAHSWRALTSGVDGMVRTIAAENYLRLAVSDSEWLAQPGGAPVPDGMPVGPAEMTAFDEAITASIRAVDTAPDAERLGPVAQGLRIVDFGVRAGLTQALERPAVDGRIRTCLNGPSGDFLEQLLAPLLASAHAGRILGLVGDLQPGPMMAHLLEQAIDAQLSALPLTKAIDQLDGNVIAWLFSSVTVPALNLDTLATDLDAGTGPGAAKATWLLYRVRSANDADAPWIRPCAMAVALHAERAPGAESFVDPLCDALVSGQIAADDVRILLRDFGGAIPPRLVLEPLAHDPPDAVARLIGQVLVGMPTDQRWASRSAVVVLRALAELRKPDQDNERHNAVWAEGVLRRWLTLEPRSLNLSPGVDRDLNTLVTAAGVTVGLASLDVVLKGESPTAAGQPYANKYYTPPKSQTALAAALGMPAAGDDDAYRRSGGTSAVQRPRPMSVPLVLDDAGWHAVAMAGLRANAGGFQRLMTFGIDDGGFDTSSLLAASILGSPDCPFPTTGRLRPARLTYAIEMSDGTPAVDAVLIALIRSEKLAVDAAMLDGIVDRIGRAVYRRRWRDYDDVRGELVKHARRRLKELRADAETGHPRKGR